MVCTVKWKFMWVSIQLASLVLELLLRSSVHTRPSLKKWHVFIAMNTLNSSRASARIISPITANKCSDVSRSCCSIFTSAWSVGSSQCRRRLSGLRWSLWLLSIVCRWFVGRCGETEPETHRHCHQLGRRSSSCEEIRGIRFLLYQWYSLGHSRAAEVGCLRSELILSWVVRCL